MSNSKVETSYLERRSAFDKLTSLIPPREQDGDHSFMQVQSVKLVHLVQIGRQQMNTNAKAAEMKDRKVVLSTLWIFALFNYLYADVFNLFFMPGAQQEAMAITEGAVLGFAIAMETAIAMVLLSRVLKYGANRWANIIAGVFHTGLVSWTLFGKTPSLFYGFFVAIEIACTLFIVGYAWTWRNPER